MIITGTKRKKTNKYENIQKIIDSAGDTQFKNIYKNLKTEIKDKIITKLLTKLDIQNKQLEEYKQQIIALKNDLVYILKRIILSKNEEKKNNYKLIKNYSISTNNFNNSTFSPLNITTPQFKNITNLDSHNINNNLPSFNFSNISPICNSPNELDIKINNYINSIYKHNFLKNETNINEYYSLNKKENLFQEIFHKKNNIKNSEIYIGTEPNVNKKKILNRNNSKRNISSPLTKRQIESFEDRKKNKQFSSSMVNIKNNNIYIHDKNSDEIGVNLNNSDNIDDNNNISRKNGKKNIFIRNNNHNFGKKFLKVKKKSADLTIHSHQLNNINNIKNKTQYNGVDSTPNTNGSKINHNNDLKKKIKRNNHYIPLNRSPFLANKF